MLILTNGMSNHFQPAHLFEISDIEFSEMEMEMDRQVPMCTLVSDVCVCVCGGKV